MNERIREKLPTPFKAQGQQISYIGFDTAFCDLYNNEQMIKFAELIIAECADIAARNQDENMNWDISEIIKEHFGVEE